VIRQHYVPQDTRVLREIQALAGEGHEVDLICLRKPGEPSRERLGAVTIRRLALPRPGTSGPGSYVVRYGRFFLRAAAVVSLLHLRRRYRLIQVNTLPDALVFAAALPKMLGARVLLDLQECMPEFFATKFGTSLRHPAARVIAALEQWSIRFAHHVITPTAQLRAAFIARGADPDKIGVVMDGADEDVFHPLPGVHPDPGGFTLISHGTVEERYGLDTVIRAVALLRDELPALRFEIYGDGSDRDRLHRLATDLGVADRVRFSDGFVPFDGLVHAIATADVGVVAMKRDAFRDLTLAGKMFDFVAMRVPVAVSRTRSVVETFPSGCFEWFDSDDPVDLAAAIRRLHADPIRRARLVATAAAATEPFRWSRQRAGYLSVVDDLLGGRRRLPRHRRRAPAAGRPDPGR
jgi:glycosyltransferase involved in cell wall biosynthesis